MAAYFGEDRLRRPDGSDGGKGALRKELAIAKHEVTKEVATAQQHIDAELLELRRELSNIKTQESSLESRTLAIVQNLETRIDRIIQFQHEQNAAITAASDEFERERKTEKPVVPDANGAPERPIQQSPSGNMDHTVLIEKLNDIAAYSAYDPDQTQSAFGGVDHSAMITPEVGNSPMVQRVSKVYRPVSLPSAMPQVAPNGVTPGLLTPVPGSHHASGAFFLNNIIG